MYMYVCMEVCSCVHEKEGERTEYIASILQMVVLSESVIGFFLPRMADG